MEGPVKRQYRSKARAEAAEQTRARIRAAAAELFVSRGYEATSLKEVAERAGVGERTLYDSFGSKIRLLRHTVNMLTMGDDDRTRAVDRSDAIAARELDDPYAALAAHLKIATDLMNRAGDLILMGETAPLTDPELARSVKRGQDAAYEVHARLAQRFEERGELRVGLDAATAGDITFALCSPHLFRVLRRMRRWSQTRYYEWVLSSAADQLLEPQGHRGSQA